MAGYKAPWLTSMISMTRAERLAVNILMLRSVRGYRGACRKAIAWEIEQLEMMMNHTYWTLPDNIDLLRETNEALSNDPEWIKSEKRSHIKEEVMEWV